MENGTRWWTWLMFALLSGLALIPLSVPVFPTQDGPVHLYYVDLLRGILTHTAPYAQQFQIKRFLTPYSLEYYTLLALELLFSAAFSEKLLIVGYIFTFGLGFRYLVESVAERGSPWILAGVPFCLHALVYMGFLNYSVAVAILLFECGFWLRYSNTPSKRLVVAMTAGLVLMLLTHPVPAAVFLVFAGVHLLAILAVEGNNGSTLSARLRARRIPMMLLTAMGIGAIAWVRLFLKDAGGANEPNHVSTMGWFLSFASEVQLYPLAPFSRLSERAVLGLLPAMALVAVMARIRKRNLGPAAYTLLAASIACFLLYLLAPERVNGSFYFAERFPILWVVFLLVGTAAIQRGRRWNVAAGMVAMLVTVVVFFQQMRSVRQIASQIASEQKLTAAPSGSVGLIISATRFVPYGLQFNPYMWCGVQYFRRSHAILANDPWMELPLIMIEPAHSGRWSFHDPADVNRPFISSASEGSASRDLDFVVQMGSPDFEIDRLLQRLGWTVQGRSGDLMRVYRRP